jgi:hypothetical protein
MTKIVLFALLFACNALTVLGCNGGSLSISAWSTYTCTATTLSKGWDYRLVATSDSDDNYEAAVYESSTSSLYFVASKCKVTSDGTSCFGQACIFSTRNDCDSDVNGLSSSDQGYLQLKITCSNWWYNCDFSTVSAAFYTVTSTPSPSPLGSPAATSTSVLLSLGAGVLAFVLAGI